MLPGPRKDRILGFHDFPTQSREIWVCNKLTVLQRLSLCTGGCLMLEAEQVDAGAGIQGLRTKLINSRVWSLQNASLDRQGLECLLVYKKNHTVPLKPEHLERIASRGCVPKLISSPAGKSSISGTISCTEQPLDLVAEQHPSMSMDCRLLPANTAFKIPKAEH